MYVCIYIPVKVSCFHKLQQRSLQFFCTSAPWSMKHMCTNLITQPVSSLYRLESHWNLFVCCKQNSISPNWDRNYYSPLQKWVMGHQERKCSGNIRSQLYQGLLHSKYPGTLIKPFSFATCAVDNSWSFCSLLNHPALQLFQHQFQTSISHSWPFRHG